MRSAAKPHLGGHLGLTGLVIMLLFTGCVAVAEQRSEAGAHWLPAWAQTTSQTGATTDPAGTTHTDTADAEDASDMLFIVRFENEPLLGDVGKAFRRDPKSAQDSFKLWQKQNPDMQGLRLVRASYSGELILALASDDPQGRQAGDVLRSLRAMPTLIYAEPDSLAKTSH